MTHPTVCAVMLTCDRPDLARRAVECFRAQTYAATLRLTYDSSKDDGMITGGFRPSVQTFWDREAHGMTIGELRNSANAAWQTYLGPPADIIAHWDDDDYSHPERIAEQVALLQSSGADAVGYNEMLFWRERPGEAWLYYNPTPGYALGTSLCYWRKTWESRPFEARPSAAEPNLSEDAVWLRGVRCVGVTALPVLRAADRSVNYGPANLMYQPRMIARIHPGNTSRAYDPAAMRASERQGDVWRRVPEWDEYCRGVMQ